MKPFHRLAATFLAVGLLAGLAGCNDDEQPKKPRPTTTVTPGAGVGETPTPQPSSEAIDLNQADEDEARLRAEQFVEAARTYSYADGDPNGPLRAVESFVMPSKLSKWKQDYSRNVDEDWRETVRTKREGGIDLLASGPDSAFDQTRKSRVIAVSMKLKTRTGAGGTWSTGDSVVDMVWLEKGPAEFWYVTRWESAVRTKSNR